MSCLTSLNPLYSLSISAERMSKQVASTTSTSRPTRARGTTRVMNSTVNCSTRRERREPRTVAQRKAQRYPPQKRRWLQGVRYCILNINVCGHIGSLVLVVIFYFIPFPSVQFGTKSSEPGSGSWRWKGVAGPPGTNQGAAPSESSPAETWSIGSRSTTPRSGEYDAQLHFCCKVRGQCTLNERSLRVHLLHYSCRHL